MSYSRSLRRFAAVVVMVVATPKISVVTRTTLPPSCPPPGGLPMNGPVQLEAYSDPERYSRITFCNGFFNLLSLTEAIEQGKSKPAAAQNNLETWNSRARTFFHEATHLDYFMNAPKKSPYVGDTTFSYRAEGASNKLRVTGRSTRKF